MAAVVIAEAIEVGAPAYNAGDISLCEEVYEVAATQLVGSLAADLKPEVSRALEAALRRARSLSARTDVKGSETDELAWSFRRAFDQQLAAGGGAAMVSVGAASRSAALPSSSALGVVEGAIRQGVPMFNGGDAEGCARVYTQAIRSLVQDPSLGDEMRAMLRAVLEKSPRLSRAEERAWELRRALDQVRSGQSARALPTPSRSVGGGAGRRVLCDFARGSGLEVRAAVVNDTVMGGRSDSSVGIKAGEGAMFQGNVTRRGGGGFASVRFTPVDRNAFSAMIATASGLSFTVRCGRGSAAWKLQLNESRGLFGVGTNWQADFMAPERDAQVDVPFSSLVPTMFGKPQGRAGLAPAARDGIESFGFMLSFLSADGGGNAAFQEGPFALVVKSVEVF